MRRICLLTPKRYRFPFTSQSHRKLLLGGPSPNLGERVELEVRCGTPRKSSILGKICLLEPKCYLSPFMSQSQYIFCMGIVPNLGGRSGVRGSSVVHPESPSQ